MGGKDINRITVKTTVNLPAGKVWSYFTKPENVKQWNHASDNWHCPSASSELKTGGTFCYTMAAKDGSMSFDFTGTFTELIPGKSMKYEISDGRKVEVGFIEDNGKTEVISTFEAENQNSLELQENGWQAILDSFKQFAEKAES